MIDIVFRHSAASMLRNAAARRGLAPPMLRPVDAALPFLCRETSSSSLPVRKSRRAESERKKNKSPTSPAPLAAAAAPLGSDDRSLDLAQKKEKKKEEKKTLLLGDGLPTQEAAYDALARIAVDLLEEAERSSEKEDSGIRRVVVGLAGGPGSGKSTAAAAVVERVNELWRERRRGRLQRREGESEGDDNEEEDDDDDDVAVVLPMDGFHLTRAQLAASADPPPEEMFARRGAHWTFDGAAFVQTVRDVVESAAVGAASGEIRTVLAPSFDHGVGDPCPGAVAVEGSHRLVLVEGNYLLLPLEPWSRLVGDGDECGDESGDRCGGDGESTSPPPPPPPPLLDQTWFLDVDLAEAMERVRRRQAAVGVPPEVSRARVEGNDRPNGELVASTRGRADVVVRGDLPLLGRGVEGDGKER